MNTTVYLLRHTQYESPEHILPVRLPGFHLSHEGRATAKKIAEFFSEKIHKNIILDDRLLEIRSPTQGKTEEFGETMGEWNMYESDWYKQNGGESREEIFSRMDTFIKEKIPQNRGKEFIVVSHGDPIMLLLKGYLGKMPEYIRMGGCLRLTFDINCEFAKYEVVSVS
jgi:broad specificity phosphatase PhoE